MVMSTVVWLTGTKDEYSRRPRVHGACRLGHFGMFISAETCVLYREAASCIVRRREAVIASLVVPSLMQRLSL